jgi:hypothetical protein
LFFAKTDLLDSSHISQSDTNATGGVLLSSDYELNGTLNRAASEGAKFSLILAMLEQDCTQRPYLDKSTKLNQIPEIDNNLNHYRNNPLSANDQDWQNCQQASQLINSGQLHSARLWLAMHPEPLSQHNKSDAINADVVKNCSLSTQTRIRQTQENVVNIDETGLYDILQQLQPISA